MSDCGAAIRTPEKIEGTIADLGKDLAAFNDIYGIGDGGNSESAYKLKDMMIMQNATLSSMLDFSKTINSTRGSALYYNPNGEKYEKLEDDFRFILQNPDEFNKIQETYFEDGSFKTLWRDVRPIPEKNDFFENIWNQYCINKNVY